MDFVQLRIGEPLPAGNRGPNVLKRGIPKEFAEICQTEIPQNSDVAFERLRQNRNRHAKNSRHKPKALQLAVSKL